MFVCCCTNTLASILCERGMRRQPRRPVCRGIRGIRNLDKRANYACCISVLISYTLHLALMIPLLYTGCTSINIKPQAHCFEHREQLKKHVHLTCDTFSSYTLFIRRG